MGLCVDMFPLKNQLLCDDLLLDGFHPHNLGQVHMADCLLPIALRNFLELLSFIYAIFSRPHFSFHPSFPFVYGRTSEL